MAHDVFISYATADQTVALMVCSTLEKHGIRCWMAPRDVQPGDEWGGAIVDAIKASRAMVLVFSGHANESHHIPRELERAIGREIPIVPVRIENVEPRGSLEYSLSSVHWLDAISPPVEAHVVKLADRLRKMLHLSDDAGPVPPQEADANKPPVIVPPLQPHPPAPPPPDPHPVIPGPGGQAPSRMRGVMFAGAAVLVVLLIYALSHQSPASTSGSVKPSPQPSTPAQPNPTPPVAVENLRPLAEADLVAFPTHRIGSRTINRRQVDDLKREADRYPRDPRPAIDLGDILYDGREYGPAISWYLHVLELTPDNVDIRIDLAMAYWHDQRDVDAVSQLQGVLATQPRNPLALLNLGVIYVTQRKLPEAAEIWRRVIEVQPGTWQAQRAREMLDKIGAR